MGDFQLQKKRGQKLGLTITGGIDGIFIKRIGPDGVAAGSGLEVDDQITACNGKSFDSLSKESALEILKKCGSKVRLTIQKKEDPPKKKRKRMTNGETSEVDELRTDLARVTKERDYLKKILQNINESAVSAVKSLK